MKEDIGNRIKSIRENMNMTKEEFAKLLGVTGQYLGMVEHGKCALSIEKLKVLCDVTRMSADYILFGKNNDLPNKTKKILSEFTDEQLKAGLDTLQKLAILIKKI